MHAFVRSTILLLLSAFAVPAWAAPPLAGELANANRLEFSGQRQFPAEHLKRALEDDLDFLLAADPTTPLDEYLAVVKARLQEGYQRAGFPEASIEARADAARRRVTVAIAEGRRYMAGPIRLLGASAVPETEISRWLTTPHPAASAEQRTGWEVADGLRISDAFGEEPIWEPGKPAHFNAWARQHLTKQVYLAFAEQGYFFPQLEVKAAPNPRSGQAELQINVFDEGPSGVVGEIEMLTTGKNSREAILKLIELTPGAPLTHAGLAKIKKRLHDSARFARFDVRPQPPAQPGGPLKLKFELIEAEASPLLNQSFSPEEETLLKLRQWLLDEIASGDADLVLTLRNPAGRLRQLKAVVSAKGGTLRFDILDPSMSLGGRVLRNVQELAGLSDDAKSAAENKCLLAMEAGPGLLAAYSPLRDRKYAVAPDRKQLVAKLRLDPALESNRSVDFNLGASSREQDAGEPSQPFALDVELTPAAFVALAHNKNLSYKIEEGVLNIKSGALVVEIEMATGRLIKAALTAGLNSELGSIVARRGAFRQETAELRTLAGGANDFDARRPINSLAAFTSCELLFFERGLAGLATPSDARGLFVWQSLLANYLLPPLDQWIADSIEKQQEFFIPNTPPAPGEPPRNPSAQAAAGFTLWVCRDLFPADSWPCIVTRAAAYHYSGDAKRRRQELSRIGSGDQAGPVGLLIAAWLASGVEPKLSQRLAAQGLENLSAADFRRDYQLLLGSRSPWIKSALAGIGRLRDLPPDEVEAAANILTGQSRYFMRDLVAALRKHRDAPTETVLADVLDKYWDSRFQWYAKLLLRAMSEAPVAETVRAPKKSR
jgi:hypothetical protein